MPSETLPPPTHFAADANGDGHVTLADARVWIEQLFFLPGDWVVWALVRFARPVTAVFGLGTPTYGGLLAGTISVLFWFFVGVTIGAGYDYVADFDNRATRAMNRLYAHTLRGLRVAVIRLRARFGAAKTPAAKEESGAVEQPEADLSTLDVRILSELAAVRPGYALTAVDVAGALHLPADDARDLLDALQRGGLVVRTLGGGDDESGYTLSRRGRETLAQRLGLT